MLCVAAVIVCGTGAAKVARGEVVQPPKQLYHARACDRIERCQPPNASSLCTALSNQWTGEGTTSSVS